MPKIRYLRGSYQGPYLNTKDYDLAELARTVIDGNYNSGNLEKLRGWPLWSLRIGKKDEAASGKEGRFIFGIADGELIAVGYARKHNYKDYLNKPTIKRYLRQVTQLKSIPNLSWERDFEHSPANDTFRTLLQAAVTQPAEEPKIVDYYKGSWVELSPHQEQSLSLPMPCLIMGSAGTGKTCLVIPFFLLYLEQMLLIKEDDALPYALYITQAPHLTNEMKKTWESHPGTSALANAVRWMTYDDLLRTHGDIEGKTLVTQDHFYPWFVKYQADKKRAARALGEEIPLLTKKQARQELRILSAPEYRDDPGKYLSLGKEQSFIPVESRPWMIQAFNDYLDSLEQNKQVNPVVYLFKPKKRFLFVLADEVQNWSPAQFGVLSELAMTDAQQRKQLVLLGDPLQSMFDEKAVNLIHAISIHDMERREAIAQLTVNHRSPLGGIAFANWIISAMQRMAGGLGSHYEIRHIKGPPDNKNLGHFYCITPQQAAKQAWLMAVTKKIIRKDSNQLFCAVVTIDEYKQEASALFPGSLVLSIEEVQGLSLSVVISYKLFQSPDFKEAKKRFEEVGDKQPVNRPKADQEDHRFSCLMRQVYTIVTRCEDVFVSCETENRNASFLYGPLYDMRSTEWPTDDDILSKGEEGSPHKLIMSAYEAGNSSLACILFTTLLQRREMEFEAYIEEHREPQPMRSEATLEFKVPLTETQDRYQRSPRLFAPLRSQHPRSKNASRGNHPAPLEALDLFFSFEEGPLALYLNQYGTNFLLAPFNDQRDKLVDLLDEPHKRIIFMRTVLNFYDEQHEILLNKIELEKIRKCIPSSNKKALNDIDELFQHKKEWKIFQSEGTKLQKKYILPHRYIDTRNLKGLHQLFRLNVNFHSETQPLIPYLFDRFEQRGCLEVLNFLCQEVKADINAHLGSSTALHQACILGNIAKVKILLDLNANPNTVDKNQNTPLYIAFPQGNPHMLKLLIKSGATRMDRCILQLIKNSVYHENKSALLWALKENNTAGASILNYSLLLAIDLNLFIEARALISVGAQWDQPLILTPEEQRCLTHLGEASENLTITPKEFGDRIDGNSIFERLKEEKRVLEKTAAPIYSALTHSREVIEIIREDVITRHDIISLHLMPNFEDSPEKEKLFGKTTMNAAKHLYNKLRIIRGFMNKIILREYDKDAMKLVRSRAIVEYHIGGSLEKCTYILFTLLRKFYAEKILVPISVFDFYDNLSDTSSYYGLIIGDVTVCKVPQDFNKFIFIDPILNIIGSPGSIYDQHKKLLQAYGVKGFLERSMGELPSIKMYTPDKETIDLITRFELSAQAMVQYVDKQLERHDEYCDFYAGTKVKPPYSVNRGLINQQKEEYLGVLKSRFPELQLDITANYNPATPLFPALLELRFEDKEIAEMVHYHLKPYIRVILDKNISESKERIYTLSLPNPDLDKFMRIPKFCVKERETPIPTMR